MRPRSGRIGSTSAPRGRTARVRTRAVAVLSAALAIAPALVACGSPQNAGGNTINVYYYPEENFQKVVDKCNAQAGGQYHIVYNKLPRTADGQREQMVRRLAAGDSSLDVLGLDVTWTSEFAKAGWVQEWIGADKAAVEDGTLAGPLRTATVDGKLYAAPKNTNVQLLWYRSDLVPQPPKTWDEMISMAQQLKQQGKPNHVLVTGSQYEGLVVLYNNLVAANGGHILSDDNNKAVMDEGSVKALAALKKLATAGVTDPSMTNSQEDDVRLSYEQGNGAFQINYAFVYPSMLKKHPELAKMTKWAPLPTAAPGEPARATIGGADLAVSSYSKHKPEAFQAILCLRSKESQTFSAINDGVPPTIESVYADPAMDKPYPMKQDILNEVRDAAVRPLTPEYQNVSTVISTVLSPPDAINPPQTADKLRKLLQDALESKGVMP